MLFLILFYFQASLCLLLLELSLDLTLEIVDVELLRKTLLLANFERLGVKIFMDTICLSKCLMYLEILVSERIDAPRDNPHLIFVKPQIFNAVCILQDSLGLSDQHLQRHMLVFCKIYTQLLKLLEDPLPVV